MEELLKINENTEEVREHEVFIDDENLLAVYYPEIKLVHFIWRRRTVGDPYRKAFVDAGKYGKTHPTKYFLSDIRKQGVVGPEDRKWFETVALPDAINTGVIKVGVVFDGNTFKMYYLNILLKNFVSKGIPMKFFKDLQLSQEWLLKE